MSDVSGTPPEEPVVLRLRAGEVENIPKIVRLDGNHPEIPVEAPLPADGLGHRVAPHALQPRLEQPQTAFVRFEETLRRGREKAFRAVAEDLPHEDSPRLLRALRLHGSEIAAREDAAHQGGNENVGTKAHDGGIHGGKAGGNGRDRPYSAPISLSLASTCSFGSPVTGRR